MAIIRMVMTTTTPVCKCTKLCNFVNVGGVFVDNLIVLLSLGQIAVLLLSYFFIFVDIPRSCMTTIYLGGTLCSRPITILSHSRLN